jgi:fumarylacetoacetase
MTQHNPNNPTLKSWIHVPEQSDFPIQNIPFGIYRKNGVEPRAATRIGDTVIDLWELADAGFLASTFIDPQLFRKECLNDFIELGRPFWRALRERISILFEANNPELRDKPDILKNILKPAVEAEMQMPVRVGDYTDFYSSIEHATNVGKMFRDPANALLPNYRHLPVGYHGRSSSIVISGTPIRRPKGQTKNANDENPVFGPTKELDFELEIAFITGKKTDLGESVTTADAEEHIFGLVLFNDLSARDIQRWEYVPLGPFLAKNFGTVISPWIVTLDALEPFRTAGPVQEPAVLPYLRYEGEKNYDINLDVFIQPEGGEPFWVCRSNFRYMYWNMAQQLAHQTVNGCNINVGDMYASGTISGPEPDSYGSMLEIAWKGTKPVKLPDGSERSFIHDNDTMIIRGYAEKDGLRIGFGEAVTKILPAF